jgi:hypothetical protein
MTYQKVSKSSYGIGLGHLLEGLQDEADFLHNHRSDNLHFSMLPMFKRKTGSMAAKKDELFPGKIIDLDDPRDFEPMVVPDLTGSTFQAEVLVRDYADRVSGANDPMSGYADPVMKSGGDTSATMFLAQQGNSILNAVYEGIEHNYGEIGQLILIQLVANKEKVDLTVVNQSDAALIQTVLDLPLETLPTTFRFKVKATELNRTEEAKNQQLQQATGLYVQYGTQMMELLAVMGNPQVPPTAKQFAQTMFEGATRFTKQLMKHYKIEGVDELFPDVGGGKSNGSGEDGSGAVTANGGGGNAPAASGGMAPADGMAPEGSPPGGSPGY